MKKTGAMILSFMLIFMMTVTNLAGAYHSAAQVYAAEETDGGEDNTDGGTQGGDETALTNTALPTGDVTQSGNQVTTITPPQETAPATTFTVTFDANGHGTAPDAVTVTEGSTAPKPDDLTAEGFMFDGWFRDANAKNAICCRVLTKGFDMAEGQHRKQCIAFTGLCAGKLAEILCRELGVRNLDAEPIKGLEKPFLPPEMAAATA